MAKNQILQALFVTLFYTSNAHADVATEADVIDMIETCIAFVETDAEYEFSQQWLLDNHEERQHTSEPQIHVDRDLVNLQFRVEIEANDRIDTQARSVIDRQCLITSMYEAPALRFQSEIEGYTGIEPVIRAVVEQAADAFMAREVAASRYVNETEKYQSMYPNDPPEVVTQSCFEPHTLIKATIYEEGSYIGWAWTISVVRHDSAPEACSRS